MIDVNYKRKKLKIRSVWFYCQDDKLDYAGEDFVYFHGVEKYKKQRCMDVSIFNTLLTDLSNSEEEIFQSFSKTNKAAINKSNREGIVYKYYNSQDIIENPILLEQFRIEYDYIVNLKGIPNVFNPAALKAYLLSNNLVLTVAQYEKENLVQHIYVRDEKNIRKLYSVSNFRGEEINKAFVGRANKGLHWFDIKLFKSEGIESFNWGGVSSFTKPNGVDSFKMSFGGKQVVIYNVILGVSFLGKLILYIKKILKK